jgi:DNA repair protein RecO (recombination protein O)
MYHTTRGIFLKHIKYSDTSAVLRIYTEEFGLQSYMVKGFHGKRSKLRPALFQPLSLLNLVVSHRDKGTLESIREARPAKMYVSATTDMTKNAVILFLNELLFKTLQEEEANPPLFRFIFSSLEWLDEEKSLSPLFHIKFCIELSRFLGFYPEGSRTSTKPAFDLLGGTFCTDPGMFATEFITGPESYLFSDLLGIERNSLARLRYPAETRRKLLDKLLIYYEIHIPSARDFKSHKILHEVMR